MADEEAAGPGAQGLSEEEGQQELEGDLEDGVRGEAARVAAEQGGGEEGVRTMPARLEKEPAQIAAGTLPRAIEVKAMEDCTVEGTRQRKSRPP